MFFLRWLWFNFICGISLIVIGLTIQHSFFDQKILQWIGLMTHKPATEDYVPFLPWFGVLLLGMALGKYLHLGGYLYAKKIRWGRQLIWMGQHSLLIYMLHQPILLGGLWILWYPYY